MRAGWSRWGCGLGLGLLGLPALARAASPVPAPGVDLWQVFVWSLLPVAATLCAILVALTHRPSAGARSALQHLAAGIVFAAVATEIVPEMLAGGHVLAVASGFAAGVALMFGVRVASDAMSEASSTEAGGSASGWSMLMATGIAPRARHNWINPEPTPPDAPVTTTVSPFLTRTRSSICSAVR